LHVSAPQQSSVIAHDSPEFLHAHIPSVHCIEPQHSAALLHGWALRAQHCSLPAVDPTCAQVEVPQHSPAVAGSHESPMRPHPVSSVHDPRTQMNPSQHSPSLTHMADSPWHSHMPSLQSM
jgi:hypothetical protein